MAVKQFKPYYQACSKSKGICGHKHSTKASAIKCGKKMKDCESIGMVNTKPWY